MSGIPSVRHELVYNCCPEPYPDVTFYIQIQRMPLFYLLNLIFPCTLISTVAFLGFLLPPDSGEKISLEITVLLSLALFLLVVSETMRPDSETIPFIGIYFACAMVLVSLSCLMTLTALNIHFRGNHGKKMPPWVRKVFLHWFGRMLHVKVDQKGHFKKDRVHHVNINNHKNDLHIHEIHENGGFTGRKTDELPDHENNINKLINDINEGSPNPISIPEFGSTSQPELIKLLKRQSDTLDYIREYVDEKAIRQFSGRLEASGTSGGQDIHDFVLSVPVDNDISNSVETINNRNHT